MSDQPTITMNTPIEAPPPGKLGETFAEIVNKALPPQAEHILQFFAFEHLPPHLQAVSEPFHRLANNYLMALPRNPERAVALRKLLEAKDAAVRAALAK